MRYIRNFVLFWRDFILGDDKRIAISIMWFCIVTYAWTHEFYNVWYVLPVAILALLTILLFVDSEQHVGFTSYLRGHTTGLYVLFWPMFVCVVAPSALFRIANGDTTSEHLVIPMVITTGVIALYTAIAGRFMAGYPSLVSFIGGVIAYVLVTYMQPIVSQLSVILARDYAGMVEFIAVVAAAVYIIRIFRASSAK